MSTTPKRFKPIQEQTLVITGATSGIGLATAKKAAKSGARVVLSSRNVEDLDQLVNEIQSEGGQALGVRADVANLQDLENLRDEAIRRFGSIDTWVNNAGVSMYGKLLETPLSEEKEVFETNFWGTRHGSRVAVKAMKDQGGVLINVGSEVSARSIPLQGIYASTKHAVKAYTDALRMELEHDQVPIFVSLVRPTAIDTPFPQHATSYLAEGEPSLPTLAYHPDVVADAILRCAVHPQRDVFVGAQSRVFYFMDALFPRFTDRLMETLLFREQSRGTKVPHTEANEALYGPAENEGEKRGGHKGVVLNSSAYTFLAQRPVIGVVGGVAAIAAGAYLLNRKRLREAPEGGLRERVAHALNVELRRPWKAASGGVPINNWPEFPDA